jgi:hypothetical protein
MEGMWTSITSIICLLVGLVAGYLVGYRSGTVAGELAALKSMRHRFGRDDPPRRSRRSGDEGRRETSDDME